MLCVTQIDLRISAAAQFPAAKLCYGVKVFLDICRFSHFVEMAQIVATEKTVQIQKIMLYFFQFMGNHVFFVCFAQDRVVCAV